MSGSPRPIEAGEFAQAMAGLVPFEPGPRLALAVSGGVDSMALALLAAGWLRERGGQGVALVVDHRLRPGSGDEARQVAQRCRAMGLGAEVLTREGMLPETGGIEAAAREARYALLEQACLAHRCLHLLVAHHADDQAETIALRAAAASGRDGLAGMSACVERAGHRLLRPLLGFPRSRLAATTAAAGLSWVEDPMNTDPRFARARLRSRGVGALPPPSGRDRAHGEHRLLAALPGLVALDRFGVARLDRDAWRRLQHDLRVPVLARIALATGAGRYGPASSALGDLRSRLSGEGTVAATLGGCLWRAGRAHVTVCREARNLPGVQDLHPGVPLLWDGRHLVESTGEGLFVLPVAALGQDDLARLLPLRRARGLTATASAVLPAILDLEGLAAVPHLGYARPGGIPPVSAVFRPRHALSPVPFVVAGEGAGGNQKGRGALLLA